MGDVRIRRLVLPALAALVVLASVCDAADEAPGLPRDEWQAVFMGAKRIGYAHIDMRREGDVVVTRNEIMMTLRRFGTDVTVKMEETFRERVDGTPLSFSTVQETGGMAMRTAGTITAGKLHLVTAQGTRRREKVYDWDAEAVFPYALERTMKSVELKPGAAFTVKVFSPDASLTEPVEVALKVIGPETVDVLGVAHEAIKIESRISKLPGVVETSWVDSRGDALVTAVSVMKLRLVRCTKEYALGEVEPAEIGDAMLVKPDKQLWFPGRLKRLVVRLSTEDGSPFAVELASAGHQRVVERTEESVTLEISIEPAETEEKNLAPYRARSTFVDCEDERIVAAARKAVGDETDPWRKAQALRRAVYELVEAKSFDVAMATASEVIQNKEGDCTEHAVLLAAMARAEGLPSRVAIGLMYIGGRFGYHMWTQVYVDGAWRDVDAVLPGRDFDAAHIRLATSALNDDDFLFDIAAFAAVFGNLKIEILEKEYAKRQRPD